MYGVMKMSSKIFAVDFEEFSQKRKEEYIESMLMSGIAITLVNDLESANDLFNYEKNIEVILPDFEE